MNATIEKGYQPGAIGWVAMMHGRVYVGEQQWNAAFEIIVAQEIAKYFAQYDAKKDGFWMARVYDEFAASITVVGESESVARIRFFVADPKFKGKGLGKLLLAEALAFCDAANKDVYLTTVRGLDAAKHLYEQTGFRLVDEHEDRSWGSSQIEQRWERRRERR